MRSELFPLLPYVFFPQDNADLDSTSMRQIGSATTVSFDESRLPNNTLAIYADLLNVVGRRLQQHPQAHITLTGCNNATGSERNNRRLSRSRAEAVRDYLVGTWAIDE